jgi:uncharacterized protein (TIGR03083 family)
MAKTTIPPDEFEAEQAEFVALCRGLSDDQWARPSLCQEWTVRQTVVHAAWHIHRTLGDVAGTLLTTLVHGAAQASADQVARDEIRSTSGLIEWLATPGKCGIVNFGELLIHQQDIRRPLDLARRVSAERVRPVLEYSLTKAGSTTLVPGASKRAAGLQLVATDMEWTAGDGAEVHGPAEALLMAVNGRRAALADLEGPGVKLLEARQPGATI